MLETRFTLILRPDTNDPNEARQDAHAAIQALREGWYSSVRLDGEVEVMERPDEEAMPESTIGGVPFVAFSNAELAGRPRVKAGDRIVCRFCSEPHALKAGDAILQDGTKEPSELLLFYDCGSGSYVGAIDGKLLPGNQTE